MTAPKSVTPLPEDPAQLAVSFKPGLYSKRQSWRSIRLADVPGMVGGWDAGLFASGQLAVWLSARAETAEGVALMPWMDVESATAHGDVAANIATAQELFLRLEASGLNVGLVLILTGRGFRFCFPWAVEPELAPAFLAMIRDKAAWPGIDAGPQVSGAPLALAGFRGHRSQGAKGSVHFAMLADASDVLTLTPDRYADLVAGPADLAESQRTVIHLQPRSWTPPAWRDVLDGYRRDLALRSNILRMDPPRQPERPAAIPWETIEEHLAAQGIRVTRELDLARGVVRSLSACPVCGKPGKAFLAGGARLKCFSSGCEAGQVQVDLRGEAFRPGLPLSRWAPEIAPAGTEDDAEPAAEIRSEAEETAATLEDARTKIREALAGEDKALLLHVTAGVGKTTAAEAHAIEQAGQGKTVLFAAPTLALAAEIHEKLTEAVRFDYNLTTPPRLYQKRSKDNCKKIDKVNDAAMRGYSPGLLFCLKCFHKGHCSYQRQFEPFERGGIIVASHDAAPTVIGKLQPELVIFDENPREKLLETEAVPLDELATLRPWLVNNAEKAFDKIVSAAFKLHKVVCDVSQETKKKRITGRLCAGEFPTDHEDNRPVPPQSLWDVAELTEDERQAIIDQLYFFLPFEDESDSEWQRRLYYKHKMNLAALNWFLSAFDIVPDQNAYVSATMEDKRALMFCYTKKQHMAGGHRVIVLDATPDVEELNKLMCREFKVVKATVPPKKGARLVHVKVAMGKTKATRLADVTLLGYIKKAHAYLKPADKKVLLLTHKRIAKKLLDMARQLDPSRTWDVIYHFAGKGLNAWEDFDAGLVIGTPTVPVEAYFNAAVAIFGHDLAKRTAWIAGLGMRDLIQSISRLRPVLRPKTVVVVGRHWPAEALGAPSFTVDESRKGASHAATEEAYQRLLPLARHFGLMFSELAAVAGVFRAEDKAGRAEWVEKIQPTINGESPSANVPTLIYTIIRVGTLEKGVSSPIQFRRRADWSELMARLADATGLPEIEYRPGSAHGGGRAQAALGTIESVMALCQAAGKEFDPTLWAFASPDPAQAPTEDPVEEVIEPASTPTMPSIRPEWATIHRRAMRPWLPPALAAIPVLPPGLPPGTYFPPLAQRMVAGMVAA